MFHPNSERLRLLAGQTSPPLPLNLSTTDALTWVGCLDAAQLLSEQLGVRVGKTRQQPEAALRAEAVGVDSRGQGQPGRRGWNEQRQAKAAASRESAQPREEPRVRHPHPAAAPQGGAWGRSSAMQYSGMQQHTW